MPATAVLVMAYGTPRGPDDVEAYYTHVRRGRAPTPEQLGDLRRRYGAIGGMSPLAERTRAQVDALQRALDAAERGRYRTFLGHKHAPPFIEDAVAAAVGSGAADLVSLVLAPHYSALSVGEYFARVRAALDAHQASLRARFVPSWHLEPELVELLARRVADARSRFPPDARVETVVTAHSLPERVLATGDPYVEQLRATAEAVAMRAGAPTWRLAFQSAGRTPEPWLGPDLLEVIRGLGAEGWHGLVVCPAGFVSDHLEVLYDIDIEARTTADAAGLRLERTASLNDDPGLAALLARLVRSA